MEPRAYIHRQSGELVQVRFFDKRQHWEIFGETKVTNPYTKEQQAPTEEVFAGDVEVSFGTGVYGPNKEQRFIVPKWAFPLCYVVPDEPKSDLPTEIAQEAPTIIPEDFNLF